MGLTIYCAINHQSLLSLHTYVDIVIEVAYIAGTLYHNHSRYNAPPCHCTVIMLPLWVYHKRSMGHCAD